MNKMKSIVNKKKQELPDAYDLRWQDIVDRILEAQQNKKEGCVLENLSNKFIEKLKKNHYTVIKFKYYGEFMYRIVWYEVDPEDLDENEEIM